MPSSPNLSHECLVCGATFSKALDLGRHQSDPNVRHQCSTRRSVELTAMCSHCSYFFSSEEMLHQHQSTAPACRTRSDKRKLTVSVPASGTVAATTTPSAKSKGSPSTPSSNQTPDPSQQPSPASSAGSGSNTIDPKKVLSHICMVCGKYFSRGHLDLGRHQAAVTLMHGVSEKRSISGGFVFPCKTCGLYFSSAQHCESHREIVCGKPISRGILQEGNPATPISIADSGSETAASPPSLESPNDSHGASRMNVDTSPASSSSSSPVSSTTIPVGKNSASSNVSSSSSNGGLSSRKSSSTPAVTPTSSSRLSASIDIVDAAVMSALASGPTEASNADTSDASAVDTAKASTRGRKRKHPFAVDTDSGNESSQGQGPLSSTTSKSSASVSEDGSNSAEKKIVPAAVSTATSSRILLRVREAKGREHQEVTLAEKKADAAVEETSNTGLTSSFGRRNSKRTKMIVPEDRKALYAVISLLIDPSLVPEGTKLSRDNCESFLLPEALPIIEILKDALNYES